MKANYFLTFMLFILSSYYCLGQDKFKLEVGFDPYVHYSDEDNWLFSRPVGFTPSFRLTYKTKKFDFTLGRHFVEYRKIYNYDTMTVQDQLYSRMNILYQLSIAKSLKVKKINLLVEGGFFYNLGTETRLRFNDLPIVREILFVEEPFNDIGISGKVGVGTNIMKTVEINFYATYLYYQKLKINQVMLEAFIGFTF
jgi:hypothetical protein